MAQITTKWIADGAITAAKISDGAITATKLDSSSTFVMQAVDATNASFINLDATNTNLVNLAVSGGSAFGSVSNLGAIVTADSSDAVNSTMVVYNHGTGGNALSAVVDDGTAFKAVVLQGLAAELTGNVSVLGDLAVSNDLNVSNQVIAGGLLGNYSYAGSTTRPGIVLTADSSEASAPTVRFRNYGTDGTVLYVASMDGGLAVDIVGAVTMSTDLNVGNYVNAGVLDSNAAYIGSNTRPGLVITADSSENAAPTVRFRNYGTDGTVLYVASMDGGLAVDIVGAVTMSTDLNVGNYVNAGVLDSNAAYIGSNTRPGLVITADSSENAAPTVRFRNYGTDSTVLYVESISGGLAVDVVGDVAMSNDLNVGNYVNAGVLDSNAAYIGSNTRPGLVITADSSEASAPTVRFRNYGTDSTVLYVESISGAVAGHLNGKVIIGRNDLDAKALSVDNSSASSPTVSVLNSAVDPLSVGIDVRTYSGTGLYAKSEDAAGVAGNFVNDYANGHALEVSTYDGTAIAASVTGPLGIAAEFNGNIVVNGSIFGTAGDNTAAVIGGVTLNFQNGILISIT